MTVSNIIITVLGGLALFLFGMKTMSDGLQKVAGPTMRTILSKMTGNRFSGVLTGTLITSMVQSSSATTVMLISFVSAELLTLTQAVGVVMGANIGTTMTGWIVALFGFKFKIILLSFPAIFMGFLPRLLGMHKLADWGEVLLGFGLLFLGLDFMKESAESLKDSAAILAFVQSVDASTLMHRMGTVAVGAIITMIIQSSSATMTITMTLAAQGIIDVPSACALVLGENIGTTITANLAALGASREAKQTAVSHSIFNLFGALWAIVLFNPYLQLIDYIVPGELMDSSTGTAISMVALAAHVAMFHTMFNVINTGLCLPFVKQIAWAASKIIPSKVLKDRPILQYLDPHVISSPPMALHAVRLEVRNMTYEVKSMLDKVLLLIESPVAKMGLVADAISQSENKVDYLEKEIVQYLVIITQGETSRSEAREITGLIGAVHYIERIGDRCEALHKLLARRYDQKIEQSEEATKQLMEIGNTTRQFLRLISDNLEHPSPEVMVTAQSLENSIDEMRIRMRDSHISRLHEQCCSVASGLMFIDMLTSFEKIGDHAYSVAQVLGGEH
ncbi:MAG: Na/Pi cotransporter family protein [Desulfocapsaceae bacterium]|nr:Na/Pi cotransporter family protein [Desulfocapsaceae bacterium]